MWLVHIPVTELRPKLLASKLFIESHEGMCSHVGYRQFLT